jgi:sec-independent protein translocase protein TatA
MPFGLGLSETILIFVVILLFFGPKRLPEMGSALGRGIRDFKRALSGIELDAQEQQPRSAALAPQPEPPAVVAPPAAPEQGAIDAAAAPQPAASEEAAPRV